MPENPPTTSPHIEPYEFTTRNMPVKVKGHGWLYTGFSVEALPSDIWDPTELVGLTVRINGVLHRVKGVERYGGTWRGFGILV